MANLFAMNDVLEYEGYFKTYYEFSKFKIDETLDITKLNDFKNRLNKLIGWLIELESVTIGNSLSDIKYCLKISKKIAKEVRDIQSNEFSTNRDLQVLASDIVSDVFRVLNKMKQDGVEVKDWVENNQVTVLAAIEHIASCFHSTREISVFDYKMSTGEHLLAFKNNSQASFVHTYGTDSNIDDCQIARDAGVDNVAKQSIYKMTRNTFDISLCLFDSFNYFDFTSYRSDEEYVFSEFLNEKTTRSGGYIIFNIPYGKLPRFERKISSYLKVEGIYRTDDEMGNLIFVTTFAQTDEHKQKLEIKRAYLSPKKLPHYEECSPFSINKGELTLPETFMPSFVDERDILDAFKTEESPLDFISSVYEPKERAVELSRPLMEYKKEHLAAVAVSEVVNGIYDTSANEDLLHESVNYPHIFSSKIVQKYVNQKKVEMIQGKEVEVFATQKQSALVFKVLLPNGEIKELLNTR